MIESLPFISPLEGHVLVTDDSLVISSRTLPARQSSSLDSANLVRQHFLLRLGILHIASSGRRRVTWMPVGMNVSIPGHGVQSVIQKLPSQLTIRSCGVTSALEGRYGHDPFQRTAGVSAAGAIHKNIAPREYI